MYPQNLHTHGPFSDGLNDYEDTIEVAIRNGLSAVGFSDHAQMSYCKPNSGMLPHNVLPYQEKIRSLKAKYEGKIDVFCGIEYDLYSEDPLQDYDYVIASVHYLKKDGSFLSFDRGENVPNQVIDEGFGGNGMAFAKYYYETLMQIPNLIKQCDIVAHFDLIAKKNGNGIFFNESDPVYRAYAIEALRKVSKFCPIFEINTGAMSRGFRPHPYPAPFLLKEIKKLGCDVVISSDSHDNRNLTYGFAECERLAKECGFTHAKILTKNGFADHKL